MKIIVKELVKPFLKIPKCNANTIILFNTQLHYIHFKCVLEFTELNPIIPFESSLAKMVT